ncbi:MAG TPA: ABC transporter ATP-binding protein [Acidimicrobiales bacterium]|nr:ABC transporter ATP-binding protein [Acidimicrobiales bacterium]
MQTAIDVQTVSKRFRLYKEKYTSLKERVLHAGRVPFEDFWALKDVEFEVQTGETVGILGRNGSGKSTLLKCVAGILQPTSGQIVVRGHVAAMLELGAGFQPELSGRDNVFLNASLLGLPRREIERRFDDIVAFAELEEFIDNQVRFYSSGMYVRLGFAVAVNVEPDVLLIDEVLAVGDERFQQKCMERVHQFQREGRTIVVVSHSADVMRQICDRVVVIEDGKVVTVAPPGEAIRAFRDCLLAGEVPVALPPEEQDAAGTTEVIGQPERRVVITDAAARHSGPPGRSFLVPGDSLRLEIRFQVNEPLMNVAFGCEVFAANGGLIFNCDSAMAEIHQIHDLEPGLFRVEFDFDQLPLLDGAYTVNARIQDAGGGVVHARLEPAATFEIVNPGQATGAVALPLRIELSAVSAVAG